MKNKDLRIANTIFDTIIRLSLETKYSDKKKDIRVNKQLTVHIYSGGRRMTSLASQWCWIKTRGPLGFFFSFFKIEGQSLLPENPELEIKRKWLEEVYEMSCVDSSCLPALNTMSLAVRRGEHLHYQGKKATFEHGTTGCYQRHL